MPQAAATSLTHVASQNVEQQYASTAQSAAAQGSHVGVSATPTEQTGCAHVLAPPSGTGTGGAQLLPQIDVTSLTHVASQVVLQQ